MILRSSRPLLRVGYSTCDVKIGDKVECQDFEKEDQKENKLAVRYNKRQKKERVIHQYQNKSHFCEV